jgi:hypothetical protein
MENHFLQWISSATLISQEIACVFNLTKSPMEIEENVWYEHLFL